jgi:hypothetical protein
MFIQQSHSNQRRGIGRLNFHTARMTIPKDHRFVNIKHLDATVGENPLSAIKPGCSEQSELRWPQRQKPVEACIDHYVNRLGLSVRVLHKKREPSFEVRIDYASNHLGSTQMRAPKR